MGFIFGSGNSSRYSTREVFCAPGYEGTPEPILITCPFEGVWTEASNCSGEIWPLSSSCSFSVGGVSTYRNIIIGYFFVVVHVFYICFPCCVPDVDECTDALACNPGHRCVNTIGSHLCLPVVTRVSPSVLPSMTGGDIVQLAVSFPTGLEQLNLNTVQDSYDLEFSFYYGANSSIFPCENAYVVSYDKNSGQAFVNCTTTAGLP